ncbi:prolyl 3-hydroxylase OGFOD1-like isoform X2 [Artemia franciscana]|uniref:prolyl 3-hydroxylase OGFOD1-like isoform X2 n=1 Tax=Artemia franciscana TaxID=6661 RepID=UPI0032DA2EC1
MIRHAACEKFKSFWECPLEDAQNEGVFSKPFKHLILPDFIEDVETLSSIQKQLLSLDFHEKSNDLYKFRQSSDLKNVESGPVSELKNNLYNQFRKWLIEVTGIKLNATVDVSCAQYSSTDVLLCHDDELEGRRIAFIFYLVDENWTADDGGTLDLYSSDEHGDPVKIAKRIIPKKNTLVLFEVTPISYHQVSEVLSEKVRLSVSGWFHGSSLPRPPLRLEKPSQPEKPEILEQEDYFDWINSSYMNPEAQGDIQEHFEQNSEIQLQDFLNENIQKALREALCTSDDIQWEDMGPPNKRSYGVCKNTNSIMERTRDFFSSELMLLLLSNMTGLRLHPLAPESDEDDEVAVGQESEDGASGSKRKSRPDESQSKKTKLECKKEEELPTEPIVEWRRFQHGNYTLLHDSETSKLGHSLMLMYYIADNQWEQEWGGFTSFIAKAENEELLTVVPKHNCLALIYCCPATLSFVKHINNKSSNRKFFVLNGYYSEVNKDLKTYGVHDTENEDSDVSNE